MHGMRSLAIPTAAVAALALAPAAAPAQQFRNCPSSGKIQGLTAGGVSCATAKTTARRVGARNTRRTITVNGFRCRIANKTSAGRGWSCTKGGGSKFVSWVYVTG